MKKALLLFLCLSTVLLNAQNISGNWKTQLEFSGMSLPLQFNFEEVNEELKATMDSPQQQAFDLAFSEAIRKKDSIFLKMPNLGIEIKGAIKSANLIKAQFKQGFLTTEIEINKRESAADEIQNPRPQTPIPPYNYEEIEVSYINTKENFKLAGTLTFPKDCNTCKAVILISGSGAQDRNSEIFNHQLFKVVADFFSSNDIAVLRFDERGVGESEGKFAGATTYNFVSDVEAGIEFLQNQTHFKPSQIGLYGHSEGGMIAPILANQNEVVDFLVLIAPPVTPIPELMLKQQELIGKSTGMTDAMVKFYEQINKEVYQLITSTEDIDLLKNKLEKFYNQQIEDYPQLGKDSGISAEDYKKSMIQAYTDPWMFTFLNINPADYLASLKIPLVAFFGEKDLQVSPKENADLLIELVGKNHPKNHIEIRANLNHLMQNSTTGSIAEYGMIEETMDEKLLEEILAWIQDLEK